VEGLSAGQWAGIEVTAVAGTGERWTATTDSQGNFIISGAPATLNGLDEVNILDVILMAANFGQSSAANPWLCQPQ